MQKSGKIVVIGQAGIVVDAITRHLINSGYKRVTALTPASFDFPEQTLTARFFREERPDYVFLTSVKMGGIVANSARPAEFIYENIQAQTGVIHSAWKYGVKKLLYLGSSCMYPKACPQPMREEYLLTDKLEPTSEPYSIAKIAGMIMCRAYRAQYGADFITAIPADIYGPGDDFNPETGHVLPALISRIHAAKIAAEEKVTVWGTGTPKREFFYVDDLAAAGLFLMDNYDGASPVNIGCGEDISIRKAALLVKEIVGYRGEIAFDTFKPDGAPRKLLTTTKIRQMGWAPRIDLGEGIEQTYRWLLAHEKQSSAAL